MPKLNISIIMLCFAYSAIAGCGTKGPLYIPEQRYPQATSVKPATSNVDKTGEAPRSSQ